MAGAAPAGERPDGADQDVARLDQLPHRRGVGDVGHPGLEIAAELLGEDVERGPIAAGEDRLGTGLAKGGSGQSAGVAGGTEEDDPRGHSDDDSRSDRPRRSAFARICRNRLPQPVPATPPDALLEQQEVDLGLEAEHRAAGS